MNSFESLVYIAQIDPEIDSGVYKKISGVVAAAQRSGISASLEVVERGGWLGLYALARRIMSSRHDVVFLRSCGVFMLFLVPALCWVRLRGQHLIIDVPTPISIFVRESRSRKRALYKKVLFELLIWLSFPASLFPANTVIEYGPEGAFFRLGIGRKIRELGNGVDVASIPLRDTPSKRAGEFTFIGVANVADWHGYDRLIRGLADYNREHASGMQVGKAKFVVVGNGGAIDDLKSLAAECGATSDVEFVGKRTGQALMDLYAHADVAVASLALHRKGIESASELKAREYTAVGIPFVMVADDADFVGFERYIFRLKSCEEPVDVSAIVTWYRELEFSPIDAGRMRRYAAERLDFSRKFKEMVRKDD